MKCSLFGPHDLLSGLFVEQERSQTGAQRLLAKKSFRCIFHLAAKLGL